MSEKRVDLKQLIYLIKNNKDFNANLTLGEGCVLFTEDPKSLVKAINYFINYLSQLTTQPLEISLDLGDRDYLLILMAYSDKSELPEMSAQLDEALKEYNATKNIKHESGKYIQIQVRFEKKI